MKSVNSFFEQKILFRINRYFYNLTAFGGFLAFFGGGILYTQSFEKEILEFGTWVEGIGKNGSQNYYQYEKRIKNFNNNIAPQNREDSQ